MVELTKALETLTFFPQQEICNQLDERSLLLVSLLSEKWEQIVRDNYEKKEEFIWEITLSRNILMIYVNYKDEEKKKKNFQIGFKEDPNSREDFYFEHDTRWNSTTLHFKTAHQQEKFSFKALELISHFFPLTSYNRITVPLGPRCPDFPFRFLSQLPRAPARYVDLQADREVECNHLVKFLRKVNLSHPTVRLKSRLSVNLRMKNVVPCDEIAVHGTRLNMADARFLTRESIQRLRTCYAEIGENNLTSQDFNAFFQSWTRGEKHTLNNISFSIRNDQKINMEEVLKGLRVHVGKQRVRDRWHLTFQRDGDLYPKAIDCEQAHTILKCNGYAGAILLKPNRLSFFNFSKPHNWSHYDSLINKSIQYHIGTLQRARIDQKQLEMKIAAQGVKAEAKDLEELVRGSDSIETKQKDFKKALEVKEKLYTVWKNDGVVQYRLKIDPAKFGRP